MIGCLPMQALAFSPVSIQMQRTQRKRLRLDRNRALVLFGPVQRNLLSDSAYQSPTSLLGSISGSPVDDSWYFRDTGCKRTADGLSLLLARRPGTHWLTIWEIRVTSVTRDSFRILLKTHLFALYWSIQRIRGFMKMRYTNLLLTYLLTYLFIYLLTYLLIDSPNPVQPTK